MAVKYTEELDTRMPQWKLDAPSYPIPFTAEEIQTLEKTALYGGIMHRLILTAQYYKLWADKLANAEAN